jgi:hypothetical protein
VNGHDEGPLQGVLWMKRVYTTSKVMAGGTELKVRQVLLKGDSRVPERVAAATVSARLWMNLARPHYLTQQTIDVMQPIFRFCFHADATPERRDIVRSVLQTIDAALQRPFAVKVLGDQGGTLGYVRRYYSGCVQQTMCMLQFDADDDLVHHRGEVHLSRDVLSIGDQGAITLIYAFGHKYANLRDHGWAGYFKSDSSGYEENRLTWQQCMVNADSYALFVYFLANPKLASMRVPGLMRGDRRAAAGNDDLNLGDLFG